VNARVGRHEVDFLWRARRVVVETDGFRHHGSREAFERDRARDAELQSRGYRVLRVTHRQLRDSSGDVARVLRELLRS
jgi:very-short-patch-repair endonuclease